jgi:adenine-specific DNA-methyltransferase
MSRPQGTSRSGVDRRFEKLKTLLRTLFQLDQPDLDFGIYRIMRARSAEITRFLDRELLPQVRKAFAQHQSADRAELERELERAVEASRELGVDPGQSSKVRELRRKLEEQAVGIAALEADVYDHLYRFFRRYYHEGDFISRRVYKEGVYAIPYEGEEVKLYWANHDQYYVKTSEYLRDYAFRLRPDDRRDPMRVHFRLVDAREGEHGNVKETSKRVFVTAAEDLVAEEDGELVVRFEYRPATPADWPEEQRGGKKKPPAQKDLLAIAEARILAVDDPSLKRWIVELAKPHVKADGEKADYSRLRAHLNRYTARNTFDYFIHKNLGAFLHRELDFYIKNEVMHLDDIESETAPRVEQMLSKIKVIRSIARKIIDFLAQLEDFQKKLWLKKKFVVETFWCITIGTILEIEDEAEREALLAEIAANDAQREEWVRLFGIDELPGDEGAAKTMRSLFDAARPTYSEPLTVGFLKANPTLVVDTRHFGEEFTAGLLEAVGGIDEKIDGLLVHAENFQALNALKARYSGRVASIYIDPPYNTGNDGFLYKDNYQHSCWLTMLDNRLPIGRDLLLEQGSLICHIDEHEFRSLDWLLEQRFGSRQNIGPIVWDKRNPKGDATGIASQHEYIAWAVKDFDALRSSKGSIRRSKENARAILEKAAELIGRAGGVTEQVRMQFKRWLSKQDFTGGEKAYCMIDNNGDVYRTVSMAWPNKSKAPVEYHTPLLHPLTRKKCPVPARGWRYPESTMHSLLNAGLIMFGQDETTQPQRKYLLKENLMENVPSLYYYGGSDDALQKDLEYLFPNPKPVRLGEYIVSIVTEASGGVLDFFAGSGTTGHAVINLNREDGGRRKFILVEMADYFDTVLLRRIKRITFAPDWKDGRPKRLATEEVAARSPRIVKCIRLESYEDTLNNLELRRTEAAGDLFSGAGAVSASREFREEYILRYMLELESRGSPSLLNIEAFRAPMECRLRVKIPGSDESREVNVDLLETFNYLIGLEVEHMAAPQRVAASFRRDDDPDLPEGAPRRLLLDGRLRADANGRWWFRAVSGRLRDGRRTLVIWRNRPGSEDPEGMEEDNLVLDEWFKKQGYSSKDSEFDLIYVNGDNNLENLRTPEDTWKVRIIEEDFHRLMFDVEDV